MIVLICKKLAKSELFTFLIYKIQVTLDVIIYNNTIIGIQKYMFFI